MNAQTPSCSPVPTDTTTPRRPAVVMVSFATLATLAGVLVTTGVASPARASAPEPAIRNESFVEDTVIGNSSVVLSMTASRWKHGSVPSAGLAIDGRVVAPTSLLQATGVRHAELRWYSPPSVVKELDLDPALTDAQGAQNSRAALALSIPHRPGSAAPTDSMWASLTYRLDPAGLDLTRAKFIELWVNDWGEQAMRAPGVELHIDLGRVSEDQMRAPDQPPNLRLDTEDSSPQDEVLALNEDTGVDGSPDADDDGLHAPLDLSTANPQDLAGDDYADPSGPYEEIDPRRWVRSNGSEGNRSVMPSPDSEDLNRNGILDTAESYFEYTVDLSDAGSPYLVTDVSRDYAGDPDVQPDNGWRRYRIPIDAPDRRQFGFPDLAITADVRLWVEGILSPDGPEDPIYHVKRPLLLLGGIVIAGDDVPAGPPTPLVVEMRSWPNPTRTGLEIELALTRSQNIDLTVFDMSGRRVRRTSEGTLVPGRHRLEWNGLDESGARVAPGLYLVEARGPEFASIARVLVIP